MSHLITWKAILCLKCKTLIAIEFTHNGDCNAGSSNASSCRRCLWLVQTANRIVWVKSNTCNYLAVCFQIQMIGFNYISTWYIIIHWDWIYRMTVKLNSITWSLWRSTLNVNSLSNTPFGAMTVLSVRSRIDMWISKNSRKTFSRDYFYSQPLCTICM